MTLHEKLWRVSVQLKSLQDPGYSPEIEEPSCHSHNTRQGEELGQTQAGETWRGIGHSLAMPAFVDGYREGGLPAPSQSLEYGMYPQNAEEIRRVCRARAARDALAFEPDKPKHERERTGNKLEGPKT